MSESKPTSPAANASANAPDAALGAGLAKGLLLGIFGIFPVLMIGFFLALGTDTAMFAVAAGAMMMSILLGGLLGMGSKMEH